MTLWPSASSDSLISVDSTVALRLRDATAFADSTSPIENALRGLTMPFDGLINSDGGRDSAFASLVALLGEDTDTLVAGAGSGNDAVMTERDGLGFRSFVEPD